MRASIYCNPDFYLLYLLLLKNSGECYCQNKNIGIDCTKHNLVVALMDCICSMQNHPCVRFFTSTWSQIRRVVTRRTTQDILAFSCDDLFFLCKDTIHWARNWKSSCLFSSLRRNSCHWPGIWLDGCTPWAVNKFCCKNLLHTFSYPISIHNKTSMQTDLTLN